MRNPFSSNTTLLKKPFKDIIPDVKIPKKPTTVVSDQSGDDWGMEDEEDIFGTDITNMDPDDPALEEAIAEDTAEGPPGIPGELDENNWTDDFGDKGQTSIPQDDPDEPPEPGEPGHLEWYEERDGIKRTGGGVRAGGYGKKRMAEQSRKQMNLTGSRRSSILTGRR